MLQIKNKFDGQVFYKTFKSAKRQLKFWGFQCVVNMQSHA